MGLWEIIEKATGANQEMIKDYVRCKVEGFTNQILCKCGHMVYHHPQGSKCLHPSCPCQKFQAKG